MTRKLIGITGLGLMTALLALASYAFAQGSIHKNGFETKIGWTKGGSDTAYDEVAHRIDDHEPRSGQGSELIELDIKQGKNDGYVHYVYPVGKAPITDELRVALYLRANRPGIQILARIVLPKERDPKNVENVLTTYIRGDSYNQVGRWQLLEIGRPVSLTKQQQQLMTESSKHSLDFTGAYVDHVVLNLNAGPGPTKVWIDDLEVGPVVADAPFQPTVRPDNNSTPTALANIAKPSSRGTGVTFDSNRIVIGDKRRVIRAVRYTDTVQSVLKNAGFNTICFDRNVTSAQLSEASDLGLWIAPELRVLNDDGSALASDEITRDINRYADKDAVIFWRLNGVLSFERSANVLRGLQTARAADVGHPIAADVWDGIMPYSRSVNMIGAYRWPLMTTLELPKYREWLDGRRKLTTQASPGAFTWTWIQTHLPDWYADLLYQQNARAEFKDPVGPQPEQIRLLTYTALASGCRGLGFWSDRFLADSHQGRDRLLCCALLNQEIDMLESLLTTVESEPQWIDTSVTEVKAAVLRCNQGVVVLPIWQGKFGQFVPGQAAAAKLTITVPQVPVTMQAWEVSPCEARDLKAERVERGLRVTLPEFGLTSVIVFTSDPNLMGRFQDQARTRREKAAQWSYQMATYELEKVKTTQAQLELAGASVPDAASLLADADRRLQKSKNHLDANNFVEAYHEAERALRPVRILMRAEWEKAVRGLDSTVASPFAVSFFTLPKHWQFMAEVQKTSPGPNVLPGGDFELVPDRVQESWTRTPPVATLDDVDVSADRVSELKEVKDGAPRLPKEGKQCAMLQIKLKDGKPMPVALERTLVALTSPSVKLPPGTLVQISGWVNIPAPIAASVDGALLYDSAGSEALAIRLTGPTQWKKFTVYRRVPASGTINVTVALTGIGTVYFDDIRIEPRVPGGGVIQAGAK
jgi:hypothetical protein